MKIPLTQVYFALIDDVDWSLVGQYKWYVFKNRRNNPQIYAMTDIYLGNGKRINIYMHQLIMGVGKHMGSQERIQVDHVDGNGLNNRRSNLRYADNTRNKQNAPLRRDNSVGLKGVTRNGSGYKAKITVNGR